MSKPLCLSHCRITSRHRLVRITEAKQNNTQKSLRGYVGVNSSLIDKRAMGDGVIKCNYLFQMRPR